jgi:hypothetical protein
VKFTLESVLAMLPTSDGKWPRLSDPVFPLDNTLLAREQSAQTKGGVVPDFQDLARRVCAAREIA